MGLDKEFEDLMNKMHTVEQEEKKKMLERKEDKYGSPADEDVDFEEEKTKEEPNPLTESQNSVMKGILASIKEGKKRIVLQGSAGTGKTFMVQYLIKEFRKTNPYGRVQITAPTNRAVAVLMEKQPNPPYYMEFMTIHKALFLKRKINDKTGEVTFVPDYNPKRERPFKGTSLLIVDESSMLNSMLLYFLENPEHNNLIIIYLGDSKQLNPVSEADSPIFLREGRAGEVIENIFGTEVPPQFIPEYTVFTLTEIIRQAEDNPIIHLSYNLHEIGLLEPNLNPQGHGYNYTSDFEEVMMDIVLLGENMRYLAWTNVEVDAVNAIARRRIYGTPHKVELGETIILAEPYEGTGGDLYWTNYELSIKELEVRTTEFTALNRFRYVDDSKENKEVTIKEKLTYYWINKDVMIIHESSFYKFLDMLKHIKFLTRFGLSWKAYYEFGEQFAKFGYRYALTVHKSQGGTFDKVIINMKDLNKNRTIPEKNRLWYTALTRASKNVTIYNPAFNENRENREDF